MQLGITDAAIRMNNTNSRLFLALARRDLLRFDVMQ
jgi:hypothetical protein